MADLRIYEVEAPDGKVIRFRLRPMRRMRRSSPRLSACDSLMNRPQHPIRQRAAR